MLVGDVIRRNARDHPNKTGLVFGEERLTWHEVNQRVNGLAHSLLAMGLEKGERLAILSPDCHQFVETYLAAGKMGLICVPLNTWLSPSELSKVIGDAEPKAMIVHEAFNGVLESIHLELGGIQHFIGLGPGHHLPYDFETLVARSPKQEPHAAVHEEDIFSLVYTGGTTGIPKGAMLTHKNMCASAMISLIEFRLVPDDICLNLTPLFFIGGWTCVFIPMMRGCTVVSMRFEPKEVLETIERERVSHTTMVPTMVNRVVNHPDIRSHDLSSLRSIFYPGAPMPVALLRRAIEIFGPVFFTAADGTETCATGTFLQREDLVTVGPEEKVRRLASVGKAMINLDAMVVDEEGQELAPGSGQMGELLIKGDIIMKGYWRAPELTAQCLRDGWYHTGDMATVDEEGYIYLVDRKKDMIISGGANIYPREIEEVIYSHPAVLHAAVIGVPDPLWGEAVKAVIVLKEGMTASEEEIVELCRERLGSYKKPRSVDFVETLPMTAHGKILKRQLREEYWVGHERRIV